MNLLPFCPRHARAIIAQSGSLLRYRRTFSVFYCVKGFSKRLATTGFRLDPRIYCAIVTLFAISIALSLHLSWPRQGRPRQSCSGKRREAGNAKHVWHDAGEITKRTKGRHGGTRSTTGMGNHNGHNGHKGWRGRGPRGTGWTTGEITERTEGDTGAHEGGWGTITKTTTGTKGGAGVARAGLDGRRGGNRGLRGLWQIRGRLPPTGLPGGGSTAPSPPRLSG